MSGLIQFCSSMQFQIIPSSALGSSQVRVSMLEKPEWQQSRSCLMEKALCYFKHSASVSKVLYSFCPTTYSISLDSDGIFRKYIWSHDLVLIWYYSQKSKVKWVYSQSHLLILFNNKPLYYAFINFQVPLS